MNTADTRPPADASAPNTLASAPPAHIHHDPTRIRGQALRRSLNVNFTAWIPGAFWMGATASLTASELGKYLGSDDFSFALLLGAAPAFAALFQIPGMLSTEFLGARKQLFLWTVTAHRALYILIGLLPWILPPHMRSSALLMVLITLISMSLNHFGGQAWINWMADLVPARIRGKHFARRGRVGILVIALTMLGSAELMDLSRRPWFESVMQPVSNWAGMPALIVIISLIFMIAGIVGMLDPLYFIKADEPPMKPPPADPLWLRLVKPLRDRPFVRFLAYWSLWFAATSFSNWLWWPYLLKYFEHQNTLPNPSWFVRHMFLTSTLILGASFQLGQILSYPIWGRAVDRFGRKPILFISSTLHSAGWIWWIFLCPAIVPFLFLSQFFGGFISGGFDIAFFNMQLQFNRRGGPGYQAVCAVIVNMSGVLGAILAGSIARHLEATNWHWTFAPGSAWEHTFSHYAVIILISLLLKCAADFLVLPAVIDVGGRSRSHALRFVFDNTYGTLNTLIFTPLRTGLDLTGKSLSGVAGTLTDTLTDTLSDARTGLRRWWR